MIPNNSMQEELLRAQGIGSSNEVEQQVQHIHRLIQKERSKLRQMKWITAALWALALLLFILRTRYGMSMTVPQEETEMTRARLYLAIAAGWTVPLATLSSLFLLIRLGGSSKQEVNLRLKAIEHRLTQMEKKDT